MLPILNQLKAETVLEGTGLLEKVEKLRSTFTYKSSEEAYSFDDYYLRLLKEADGVEQITLLSSVAPGTAQSYLVQLTQSLQLVTDKIESIHSRALFFLGKVRAAIHNKDGLEAAFTVWYQIAITDVLKAHDLKFTASVCKALAESEFTRLIGEEVVLEGMEDAISMLIEHLKSAKKLAMEKYKLGTEQANASLLRMPPSQGLTENEDPYPLLKQRYGSLTEEPQKPKYDDDDESENGLPAEEGDPNYVERREFAGHPLSDKVIKLIQGTVEQPEVDVVLGEELEEVAKKWREEQLDAAQEAEDKALLQMLVSKELTPMEDLVAQLPDTGFTHGEDSNADAEYVAAHPETWTPLVVKRHDFDEALEVQIEPSPNLATGPAFDVDKFDEVPSALPADKIIHDPFVGDVKVVQGEDGPTLVKEKGEKAIQPQPKPKTKPKYDDEDDEDGISVPSVPSSTPESLAPELVSPVAPAEVQPVKKDRRKITFDDSF